MCILRYGRPSDEQVLERIVRIAKSWKCAIFSRGLRPNFFAEGDLRQTINNMGPPSRIWLCLSRKCVSCLWPAPSYNNPSIVDHCIGGNLDAALSKLDNLLKKGYAPVDLVSTFSALLNFLCKVFIWPLQLEFIKVHYIWLFYQF